MILLNYLRQHGGKANQFDINGDYVGAGNGDCIKC